jgi:hypothetical protein
LPEARGAAGAARAQLRELSDQVAAILAEEQADRIAAAQQMAANLARMQQDFADRLSNPGENPGLGNRRRDDDEQRPGGSDESGRNENDEMPGLGASAEAISERAQTLADVLGVAGRADSPEDQPSAERVEQMAASLDLASLVDRLGRLPGQVNNRQLEDARATAGDGADRMEAAAEQLGAIHRAIVAPRVEDLAKLEQRLTVLDDQLDQLDTDTRVTTWHMDASELLDQLDDEGFDPEMRREFLEEMRKSGWGDGLRPRWNWGRIDGRYVAPGAYRTLLSRLSADVRLRMQEYLLGDLRASGDEPIPPQYEELVDRYYRVLARSGKEDAAAPPVRPRPEK